MRAINLHSTRDLFEIIDEAFAISYEKTYHKKWNGYKMLEKTIGMALPGAFILSMENNIQQNMEFLRHINYTDHKRTSKTPQKVTNVIDFNFGLYVGGLKKGLILLFKETYNRSMTNDEWDEFDNIFIDYQDQMGEYFYK